MILLFTEDKIEGPDTSQKSTSKMTLELINDLLIDSNLNCMSCYALWAMSIRNPEVRI